MPEGCLDNPRQLVKHLFGDYNLIENKRIADYINATEHQYLLRP